MRPRSTREAQVSRGVRGVRNEVNRFADAREEAKAHVLYWRNRIEHGGAQNFYRAGKRIVDEKQLQFAFHLTWFRPEREISREVNDGFGPADFKVSGMAGDSGIVEIKLARNLRANFKKQVELYRLASGAQWTIVAIVFFSVLEEDKTLRMLRRLNLLDDPDIILIDASPQPSASRTHAVLTAR